MYKIQTLNAISDVIHTQLSADKYTVSKDEPVPDAILVRSAAMHEMVSHGSLQHPNFPSNTLHNHSYHSAPLSKGCRG